MTIQVHGVSLHYFNPVSGSDKYYRVFIWHGDPHWNVAYHWGRDGTRGQRTVEAFSSRQGMEMAMDKKINEKLSKGYEYLGRGDISVVGASSLLDVQAVGEKLHTRIGREPVKLPSGFALVIHEVEDIHDLLGHAAKSGIPTPSPLECSESPKPSPADS